MFIILFLRKKICILPESISCSIIVYFEKLLNECILSFFCFSFSPHSFNYYSIFLAIRQTFVLLPLSLSNAFFLMMYICIYGIYLYNKENMISIFDIAKFFLEKEKAVAFFFLSFSYSINIITTSSSSTPFFHITNVFLTILSKIKQKKGVICTRAYVHIKLVFDRKQIFFLFDSKDIYIYI